MDLGPPTEDLSACKANIKQTCSAACSHRLCDFGFLPSSPPKPLEHRQCLPAPLAIATVRVMENTIPPDYYDQRMEEVSLRPSGQGQTLTLYAQGQDSCRAGRISEGRKVFEELLKDPQFPIAKRIGCHLLLAGSTDINEAMHHASQASQLSRYWAMERPDHEPARSVLRISRELRYRTDLRRRFSEELVALGKRVAAHPLEIHVCEGNIEMVRALATSTFPSRHDMLEAETSSAAGDPTEPPRVDDRVSSSGAQDGPTDDEEMI